MSNIEQFIIISLAFYVILNVMWLVRLIYTRKQQKKLSNTSLNTL